ncbi:MAG: helix-turn-helix domain-containing protein [Pseudomonadota bacterium]
MNDEALRERITRLRLEAGLTKRDLARRVGVSDVAVLYWESGEVRVIGHGHLLRLAQAFEITVSELLDDPMLDKRFTRKPSHETSIS